MSRIKTEAIRQIMLERKLSAVQVASLCGLTAQGVNNLVADVGNHHKVRTSTLYKLANGLGVDVMTIGNPFGKAEAERRC